jgi:hypothetical protein
MPICLTDEELTAVFRAARPLAVECRDQFLRDVAAALQAYPAELGPGVVHRVVAEVQARHWTPPSGMAVREPRDTRRGPLGPGPKRPAGVDARNTVNLLLQQNRARNL